jgi:hypothetical protein
MYGNTNAVLELEPIPSKAFSGAEIILKVKLRNVSSRHLWCNKRLLRNHPDSPADAREIWFQVFSPDGGEVPFSCAVRALPPEPSDYGLLRPGEIVERRIRISRCYPMRVPGNYRILAFYKDGNDTGVPPTPMGATYLGELVRSEFIDVEILPE